MTCLILCEKPSAAENFAAALGGMRGMYAGERYRIIALRGHLLELAPPEAQVEPALAKRYSKWSLEAIPWRVSELSFKRVLTASGKSAFNEAAKAVRTLMSGDELVIATDFDPSGEGELIAWETLDACGFDARRVKVSRMLFADESADAVRCAFEGRVGIPSKEADGDYLKAEARSRWDYCSMQLTRAATLIARRRGYRGIVRVGRLKSVMVSEIGRQLDVCAAHRKTTYFEVRFRDAAGRVYRRAAEEAQRFASAEEAREALLPPDGVVFDGRVARREGPGRLLDLATLSAMLAKDGHRPKEVLATYQRMYEAHIVSYPRTEDRTVTPAQFDGFLGIANAVAAVAGVDPALLVRRTPRKSHVRAGGVHGANRPGPSVPESMSDLERLGKAAPAIYALLAKSCLAMLAEDCTFDACSAHLEGNPDFKASWREVADLGFKAVLGKGADDDAGDAGPFRGACGGVAEAYVHEGHATPPVRPSMGWLMRRLEACEVGTGATRASTFADISEGRFALVSDAEGMLSLTDAGRIAYALTAGAHIADASATERLFADMARVGRFELSVDELVEGVTELVAHDKERMLANAERLAFATDGAREADARGC